MPAMPQTAERHNLLQKPQPLLPQNEVPQGPCEGLVLRSVSQHAWWSPVKVSLAEAVSMIQQLGSEHLRTCYSLTTWRCRPQLALRFVNNTQNLNPVWPSGDGIGLIIKLADRYIVWDQYLLGSTFFLKNCGLRMRSISVVTLHNRWSGKVTDTNK